MNREEIEKNFWTTLITSLLFIVLGIFMLFKPDLTITIISRCITVITSFIGIFGIYKYITRKDKEKKIDINILYSIVALIVALIVYIFPTAITDLIPIALGCFMVIDSMFKVGNLKFLKKNKNRDYGVCFLIFVLMFILGILLIANPLESVLNMNQSIGMILTFYAILDIIICYLFKNNIT